MDTSARDLGSIWRVVIYFAALGTGYMTVEIVLMQKLMMFLGYPLRALTVVLFSLLISSGLGSYASRVLMADPRRSIRNVLLAIALLIPLELLLFELVFTRLIGLPVSARFIIAVAAIFPMGFIMGMPFPLGISMISKYPNVVPWAWGINASFSVISSITTVIVSMSFGFRIAMISAVAIYLIGYAAMAIGGPKINKKQQL